MGARLSAAPAGLPAPATRHVAEERTCLRCGAAAPGHLRAAIWEEEEKGRLSARAASLCAPCHGGFLAGEVSRVEIGRWYHEAKDYRPHGWIGRIDKDLLLNVACLACGTLLASGPDEAKGAGSTAVAAGASGAAGGPGVRDLSCPSCHAVNRLRPRTGHWTTAELVP